MPFFHDVYKGWTCCNKKSVDFTEFLNIKGCQLSRHSNVKPAEPAKPPAAEEPQPTAEDAVSVAAVVPIVEPIKPVKLQRPDFNAPMVPIAPVVAPALQQAIDNIVPIIVRGDTAQPIG